MGDPGPLGSAPFFGGHLSAGTMVNVRVVSGATVVTGNAPTNGASATISVTVPAGVGTIQAFADYAPAGS